MRTANLHAVPEGRLKDSVMSAVPPGLFVLSDPTPGPRPTSANLFGMLFSKLPQNRHPEAERLKDLSRDTALDGAESKDPEDAYLAYAVRSFSTTEAGTGRTGHGLSLGPRTRTASILPCPAATSTFSAVTAAYGCKRLLYF